MITRRLIGNKPFPIPKELDEDIQNIVEKATNVQVEKRVNASELKELFIKLKEKKCENEGNEKLTINNNNNNNFKNISNKNEEINSLNENFPTKENTNLLENNINSI